VQKVPVTEWTSSNQRQGLPMARQGQARQGKRDWVVQEVLTTIRADDCLSEQCRYDDADIAILVLARAVWCKMSDEVTGLGADERLSLGEVNRIRERFGQELQQRGNVGLYTSGV